MTALERKQAFVDEFAKAWGSDEQLLAAYVEKWGDCPFARLQYQLHKDFVKGLQSHPERVYLKEPKP